MEKQISISASLKNYSSYLLREHLESLALDWYTRAREMEFPALKIYDHLSKEEAVNQSKNNWEEFLNNLIEGKEMEKFRLKIEQWKKQQHVVSVHDISSVDAMLVHSIRKFCLIKYLPFFTSEIHEYHAVVLEIEDLFSRLKEVTVSAYAEVQKDLFNKDKTSILNSKNFLHTVVESSMDGVMAYDRDCKVILWNKVLEEINNIPKEKIIGKKIWEFFPYYNQKPFTDVIHAVLNEGKTIHLPIAEYKYRKGYYETYVTPLINQDDREIQGVLTVIRDVTERVHNENLIKEKNNLIEGITASSPDLMFLFDLKELKYVFLSNPDSDILVYNSSTSGEKDILNLLHPDDLPVLTKRGEKIRNAGDDDVIEDEFRALDKKGNWRWLNSRIKIYKRDEMGVPVQTVGSIRDITERKEAEERIKENKKLLRRMNEDLEEKVSDRTKELLRKNEELRRINSDLDNFIYTASHDLKAPVSNIEGLLLALGDSLTEEVKSKDEVINILNLINVSIVRFKNTIRDLTEISKVQKGFHQSEELNKVEEIIGEIKWDIKDIISKYNAEIIADLRLQEIMFTRKNLRSIFFNLISNAIKYSSPERRPEVYIRTEKINEEIILTVKDNGLGISEGYKDKVFSMFKRAHDHVDGSGIGLYIVKKIVENNGGRIEVESEVGIGSVFRIFLPCMGKS